ncbi:hypothetical protein [Mycobacterium sp.]|jgi:hypothetical protein|nr:hypothetical protein [Mycobacterium sp.]HXB87934.1 hypothetical protein [Mycobacterium sp.]
MAAVVLIGIAIGAITSHQAAPKLEAISIVISPACPPLVAGSPGWVPSK